MGLSGTGNPSYVVSQLDSPLKHLLQQQQSELEELHGQQQHYERAKDGWRRAIQGESLFSVAAARYNPTTELCDADDICLDEVAEDTEPARYVDDNLINDTLASARDTRRVELSKIPLKAAHITELCAALSDPQTDVRTLHLENCGVTDTHAQELAAMLLNNGTLRVLSLRNNHITDRGALQLYKALKSNHTLEELLLGDNAISALVEQNIRQMLRYASMVNTRNRVHKSA
eukprot:NODE_4253_length_800_cov_80.983655_g4230_i0.p1 GENE.NODE_4253_length_800_cov_80.983655_g4230_i0~~NODE_4253_length_800_cov_80.983655_g4230_i0.p1  ORF type:complete len:255 (+),score=69.07 NODE_4253_length_800_cov_80.983655_g4230_i0:74-766(+)